MKILFPSAHKASGNNVFWKKKIVGNSTVCLAQNGFNRYYIYVYIIYECHRQGCTNQGHFWSQDSSHSSLTPNHSSSPFTQLILLVLCMHHFWRQKSDQLPTKRLLDRETSSSRAAMDQRREKRTQLPSYNPLQGLGLFKYSHTIAAGPVLGVFFPFSL